MKTAIDLGYSPRPWQAECQEAMKTKRFAAIDTHRRAGKTRFAVMALTDAAMRADDDASFLYIAPHGFNPIYGWRWFEPVGRLMQDAVEIHSSEMRIVFNHNKALITVVNANMIDGVLGVDLRGVVFDEDMETRREADEPSLLSVWGDVVSPMLAVKRGWAIAIGSASKDGLIATLMKRHANDPDWHLARYTESDTGIIAADEIERLRKDMSPQTFAAEFLCDHTAT